LTEYPAPGPRTAARTWPPLDSGARGIIPAMDEPLIWTADDIVRFTRDADESIRSWAWVWLVRHHPREAGRHAARGIADPYVLVALEALLAFEAHPTPEAVRVVEELRGRDDLAPPVRNAIEAMLQPEGRSEAPDLETYEHERLRAAPEELKRRAAAMLLGKSDHDAFIAATALGYQQHRWATDIFLDHFAVLLTCRHDKAVWQALENLRDPRSLPAILAAWVPGQLGAARLYATIHHLAGLSGPLPEGLARDVEEEARYRKAMDAFYAVHRGVCFPRVRRPATCRACGRTGEYERAIPDLVERLMRKSGAGKKKEGYLGAQGVMVCKFCGAKNADRIESISTSHAPDEAAADEEEDEEDGRDKN
jgi:hypothetical protein